MYIYDNVQRRSHIISIGAAKLSSGGAEQGESGIFLKKSVAISYILGVFFLTRFFFETFLSIVISDFIGAACRTNRKCWSGILPHPCLRP